MNTPLSDRLASRISLDPKDRRLLSIILALFLILLVVLAVFTPAQDEDRNVVPSSYLTGRYGAKAAFSLLQKAGYTVERWEQPLSELADHATPQTVLILAAPNTYDKDDRAAVRTILRKGGRVLATDFAGGMLLPASGVAQSRQVSFGACEAQPEGLQPLAAPGYIWITPRSGWEITDPLMRTDYACGGQPVVVEYPVGKGRAIWWASSSPLENESIARAQNLDLLLNSIGPPNIGPPGIGPAAVRPIYWDESLHGAEHTQWDFVSGPVWPLLWSGSLSLALIIIFSLSRRSGPVRPLPAQPRTTPIEFLDALGGLYRSAGATNTAVQIAWERFRTVAIRLTGLSNTSSPSGPASLFSQRTAGSPVSQFDASQITAAILRRFGAVASAMQPDLVAAEEAAWNENLKPRHALKIVQALRRHEETLRHASGHIHPNPPGIPAQPRVS